LTPTTIRGTTAASSRASCRDWRTGEVLTLAYMNRDALDPHAGERRDVVWSRSRGELWHKGETSGNVQSVKQLRYDCDADALLALVEPAGPACHTGERTCFHNGDTEPAAYEALACARAHGCEPRGRASRRQLHRPAALGPAADRRQGARGGRGGHRAAAEETDERGERGGG